MAMTEQKKLIIAYRSQGLSYKEIAEKLGVSIDFARTVYSRANRANREHTDPGSEGICKNCGNPLQFTEGKKKKLFCCPECRDKYHNRQKSRKAYILVCEYCGNEFVAYGNPDRRFCSRECQTLAGREW